MTEYMGKSEQQTVTVERQAGTNLFLSEIDALGRKTVYAYDAKGNVTSVTRLANTAQAVSETFTYEPAFQKIATCRVDTFVLTHGSRSLAALQLPTSQPRVLTSSSSRRS